MSMQQRSGDADLFILHKLLLVKQIAGNVLIMYFGKTIDFPAAR